MKSTRRVPSPSPRVPYVFVIPPEEEQQENPPWCCFDANEPPADCAINPDTPLSDVPYSTQPEHPILGAPIFRVGSINETSVKVATSRKLEKRQRPDALRIVERRENLRDFRDSDVIEVVKVKRGKDALTDPEEYPKMKRSKTLKARATKALQSIKNVARSSRKQHVKDLWTSSESVPGVFKGLQEQIRQQQEQLHPSSPPKPRPSLSRSNSRSLSQMFQSAMSFRPASSFHPHAPVSPDIPPPSPPVRVKNGAMPTIFERLSPEPNSDRPDSPSPSMKTDDALPPLPPSPSPPPHNAPTSPSTDSSYYPDVLMEGAHAAIHFIDLDNADRKLTGSPHRPAIIDDDDDYGTLLSQRQRDLSFEMRLDSFHFDSLSFDADGFNVSVDRSSARY